ncbi:MAG: hypothetical protein J6Z34_00430, partial [Clostridia bacterium]|nr:hypothetical protein [Clostridia bacterium]
MKKSAVSAALDVAFVFSATAAPVFTVIRYYFQNLPAAIAAAAVSGLFVAIIFRMSAIRKNTAYALKKKDAEQMEAALDALSLMDETALN